MILCSFCKRKFSRLGFQEQMTQLKVHVLARHNREAALKHPNNWYQEVDVEEVKPDGIEKKPARDAGDVATKAKWELGASGVLVVVLDQQGAHVGVSGLNALQVREMACGAIFASFKQQEAAQRQQTVVPIIGQ